MVKFILAAASSRRVQIIPYEKIYFNEDGEGFALTIFVKINNDKIPPCGGILRSQCSVPRAGIEPATPQFSVVCSTN
jgi:hypothetical protein